VTAIMQAHPAHSAHRAHVPRYMPPRLLPPPDPPPPVPRDPAAPGHRWPEGWPLRSYLELAALETAPGSARAHAGAVLWEWKLAAIGDEAALIVSELVTNAMLSTRAAPLPAPALVRMWMLGSAGASVLFLIWDATMPAPVRRVTTPDSEHGRGLDIVDALSARWGTYYPDGHPGGKIVWAAMHAGDAGPLDPAWPATAGSWRHDPLSGRPRGLPHPHYGKRPRTCHPIPPPRP
jgi:hypothetical protein